MRVCPRCQARYTSGDVCPRDGAALIDSGRDPLLSVTFGEYQPIELVGTGGMAQVYRGRHLVRGGRFAIKVLVGAAAEDQTTRERFVRETRAIQKLSHPNVVSLADWGTIAGRRYLVLEWVEGRDLTVVIRDEGPLPPARAAEIARQVAEGLGAIHRAGFVHRDVKPHNVRLFEQGGRERLKIVDFGLVYADPNLWDRLTRAGDIVGTPFYMAPEIIEGEEADPRTDLYALGVMLYEMLAGHVPFTSTVIPEILAKHLRELPAPLPESGGLELLVQDLLAKSPARRPASADEVIDRLIALDLTQAVDADALSRRGVETGPMSVAPRAMSGEEPERSISALTLLSGAGLPRPAEPAPRGASPGTSPGTPATRPAIDGATGDYVAPHAETVELPPETMAPIMAGAKEHRDASVATGELAPPRRAREPSRGADRPVRPAELPEDRPEQIATTLADLGLSEASEATNPDVTGQENSTQTGEDPDAGPPPDAPTFVAMRPHTSEATGEYDPGELVPSAVGFVDPASKTPMRPHTARLPVKTAGIAYQETAPLPLPSELPPFEDTMPGSAVASLTIPRSVGPMAREIVREPVRDPARDGGREGTRLPAIEINGPPSPYLRIETGAPLGPVLGLAFVVLLVVGAAVTYYLHVRDQEPKVVQVRVPTERPRAVAHPATSVPAATEPPERTVEPVKDGSKSGN